MKDWASSVAPSNLKAQNTISSFKTQVPLLTNASTRSSKSALTDHVVITTDHKDDHDSTKQVDVASDADWQGGLEDEDETHGEERDAAALSPIKGKVRLTSAVI
jgi:hypothetical protein